MILKNKTTYKKTALQQKKRNSNSSPILYVCFFKCFTLQAVFMPQGGSKHPSLKKVDHICFILDSCCAASNCTRHHECVWVFFFFFYLETLVPNLEEAVPGPCRHCHAVVGHAQAAHPVVVTRQDTCREATGWEAVWWRLPYVQGALWNLQTRACDTYHRWTAPPCASTAGVARAEPSTSIAERSGY